MKVIDLSNNIIFVDDIDYIKKSITYENSGFIYFKSNREPLKISDYYGNIYKGDYTKVVNYLKSLNDELEIIEDTPKEDNKILEKLQTYKDDGNYEIYFDDCYKYIPIHKDSLSFNEQEIVDKINEIIDILGGKDNE